jgi:dihydrodipicolinate synthase/N-acetylneuraminate lyase
VIPRVEERLTGAYAVLPVPLKEGGGLDLDALGEIVERVLQRGIRGLSVLADGAEALQLAPEERDRVVARTVQRSGGRATVLAGLRAPSPVLATEEGKRFKDLGVDGLLVSLEESRAEIRPGEMLTPVIAHFTAVVRDVGLPTLYDHVPADLPLTPEEVGDLFAEVTLVGIRNGTPQATDVAAQIRAVGRPISMFTSRSFDCLTCLQVGGVGAMCPVATLMPLTARRLIEKHRAGNDAAAQDAQSRLARAQIFVTTEGGRVGESPHLALIEALAAVGIVGAAVSRSPTAALSEEHRNRIRELARELVEL